MAIKLYYFCKKCMEMHIPILPRLMEILLRYFCGCEIHGRMKCGRNLQLPHNGLGVVINPNAIIGENVKIYQNVTIGGRDGSGAPIIDDDVMIGSGAVILGDVHLYKGARIGANAVVICDVPAYATAVGVPAVIKEKNHTRSNENGE